MMKAWFALILMFMTLRSVAASTTSRIEWSGISEQTKEAVLNKLPTLRTDHWTYADLDRLIQVLVTDEKFDSVRLEKPENGLIVVKVDKVRRIGQLLIQGNAGLSDVEARQDLALSERSVFDPSQLVDAGERLRAHYEALGYPKTQVDLKYNDTSPSEVSVTVIVREGPQTRLDSFDVQTKNPELQSLFERVLAKFKNQPLTAKVLAHIRTQTREKLSSRGYWRTDIPDPEIQRDIEETKATLTYRLHHSSQYTFETDGAFHISRGHLMDALGLDSYYSANPNIAGELSTKVRAYYLSQGYARVEVEAEEQDGIRPYTRRIRVKVNEGERVRIEKIEFTGTLTDDSKTSAKFLQTHSGDTVSSGYYVKDDIDQGLKNLVTDMWNHGYLHAKLVSTRTLYNKEHDKVTLSVNIDQGPLTQIQKITFEGNVSIPENSLLGVVKLEEGKPLHLNELESAVGALKQYYRDHGFLEMELTDEKDGLITYNEDNTLVHLNFKIKEGPQVHVAAILIEGNSLTRETVILKELEFKKGDILTPQAIEESTARLQRLGFFSSIEIKTLEENTQIADRTVVVKVNDRDPGLFNMGAGVTNERGLTVRGFTGLAYRNILGTGRGVSARIEGNYNVNEIHFLENKLTLGYLEPYIFNSRIRGRINATRSTLVSGIDIRQAEQATQISFSLEQDVTSHFLVIWDVWNLARLWDFYITDGSNSTKNSDGTTTTTDFHKNDTIDNILIGWTDLTFDFDYRDNAFNPTSGNFTRLKAEFGSPGLSSSRTIEYLRYFGSFTHYIPLVKSHNIVWANSARWGYLKNISNEPDGAVPFDKKGFQLGGEDSIRGFSPGEAFPGYNDFLSNNSNPQMLVDGDATMDLFKSEVRFPIWGNIGGAVFYDGGQIEINSKYLKTIENGNEDTDLTGWRSAVGLAFRYMTPIGALVAEYAWKTPPRGARKESAAAFYLSIGSF